MWLLKDYSCFWAHCTLRQTRYQGLFASQALSTPSLCFYRQICHVDGSDMYPGSWKILVFWGQSIGSRSDVICNRFGWSVPAVLAREIRTMTMWRMLRPRSNSLLEASTLFVARNEHHYLISESPQGWWQFGWEEPTFVRLVIQQQVAPLHRNPLGGVCLVSRTCLAPPLPQSPCSLFGLPLSSQWSTFYPVHFIFIRFGMTDVLVCHQRLLLWHAFLSWHVRASCLHRFLCFS